MSLLTQKEFLKRLGFLEDDVFLDISTYQFMADERQIKITVSRNFPEPAKKEGSK